MAAVLSGGGGLGAYEAGALLAFQDAGLPTPIITATSVGSINAASYVAHSRDVVGNAEALVEGWLALTPPVVGIEWTRYGWMLGGFAAAVAGFTNGIHDLLVDAGYGIHLHHPAVTWLTLGAAGIAVLLFHEHLPYLLHVGSTAQRSRPWHPDRRRLVLSALANALVAAFLIAMAHSLHLHSRIPGAFRRQPLLAAVLAMAVALVVAAWRRRPRPAGHAWHRLLRLPLRAGLFDNLERERLLRRHLPADGLRASPIRLVVTATDLEAGALRCFSNTPTEILANDPNADGQYVEQFVAGVDDLVPAIVASSALPIVFDPVSLDGRPHVDGGIVGNQPIRPAIRFGADVIVLVLPDPPRGNPPARTFIGVGLQALALLMARALAADVEALERVNALCKRAAQERGLPVEAVVVELDRRRFRYVHLLVVRPVERLPGRVLEFGGPATAAAVVRGYLDACIKVRELVAYARSARFGSPRRVVRLCFERGTAAGEASGDDVSS